MTDHLEDPEAYYTRTLEAEGHAELIRKLWALVDEWREIYSKCGYCSDESAYGQCADELLLLLPPR